MKLNPDCVRAVLLTIEENSSYQSNLSFEESNLSSFPYLSKYSLDEVLYHLRKCDEAGFLCGAQFFFDSATVDSLHYCGHEFVDNVRDSKIWGGIKEVGKKVGSASIPALSQIASNVIVALIKSQFGLL